MERPYAIKCKTYKEACDCRRNGATPIFGSITDNMDMDGFYVLYYSEAKERGFFEIKQGDPVFLEDGKIKKTILPRKVESILDELDREEFVEIFDDDDGNKGVVHRDIIRQVLEKYIKEDVYTLKVSLTDVAPIIDVLNFAMTIATEFVAKVESGKAKSIETYANMKELIKMIHDIGE